MVKKIYSKFQFLNPSLRLKEILKFHFPNALRMPFCLLQTSPWLKKFFKFNLLQCSVYVYVYALEWLFLALENLTIVEEIFKNLPSPIYLALKSFTMVEFFFQILPSPIL